MLLIETQVIDTDPLGLLFYFDVLKCITDHEHLLNSPRHYKYWPIFY